ncbi:reticulon-like protein [Schizosaccharomyces japonicus yFS275]|uniref:Reticulon-like protein n=1 Tax=Schizosaccharomyces japonicus (strain yFS275 / FY16936) TaxID=402676 RepID=B6JZ25_SCHJY|nr:reticulon-like protein [Schizosaccharomyces japonicus yFS275]EEB06793.1 reticulon-like protein [Schizosaccharomyces japonicus yFS275]
MSSSEPTHNPFQAPNRVAEEEQVLDNLHSATDAASEKLNDLLHSASANVGKTTPATSAHVDPDFFSNLAGSGSHSEPKAASEQAGEGSCPVATSSHHPEKPTSVLDDKSYVAVDSSVPEGTTCPVSNSSVENVKCPVSGSAGKAGICPAKNVHDNKMDIPVSEEEAKENAGKACPFSKATVDSQQKVASCPVNVCQSDDKTCPVVDAGCLFEYKPLTAEQKQFQGAFVDVLLWKNKYCSMSVLAAIFTALYLPCVLSIHRNLFNISSWIFGVSAVVEYVSRIITGGKSGVLGRFRNNQFFTLNKGSIHACLDSVIEPVNCMLVELQRLFLAENPCKSVSAFFLAWFYYRMSLLLSLKTIFALSVIAAFSLPPFYQANKRVIDGTLSNIKFQIEEYTCQFRKTAESKGRAASQKVADALNLQKKTA